LSQTQKGRRRFSWKLAWDRSSHSKSRECTWSLGRDSRERGELKFPNNPGEVTADGNRREAAMGRRHKR
jgi:hypothetical protein